MRYLYQKKDEFQIKGIYTAFIREADDGFLFSGEVHDFWEMMYCIKGSAVVCTGDRVLNLYENQVVFFKPMEFHSFRVEEKTGARFLIMSFVMGGMLSERLTDRVFNIYNENKHNLIDIINMFEFNNYTLPDHVITRFFLDKVEKIPYKMNEIINKMENFLISISRTEDSPLQFVNNNETQIYISALKIIDEGLGDKLTVEQLSKKCHISSTYMKRIFKKYSGIGIHEYILKTKISMAKQLLADGETVTVIAENLGFSSQNYLSTVFKRETGFSPRDYIKNK